MTKRRFAIGPQSPGEFPALLIVNGLIGSVYQELVGDILRLRTSLNKETLGQPENDPTDPLNYVGKGMTLALEIAVETNNPRCIMAVFEKTRAQHVIENFTPTTTQHKDGLKCLKKLLKLSKVDPDFNTHIQQFDSMTLCPLDAANDFYKGIDQAFERQNLPNVCPPFVSLFSPEQRIRPMASLIMHAAQENNAQEVLRYWIGIASQPSLHPLQDFTQVFQDLNTPKTPLGGIMTDALLKAVERNHVQCIMLLFNRKRAQEILKTPIIISPKKPKHADGITCLKQLVKLYDANMGFEHHLSKIYNAASPGNAGSSFDVQLQEFFDDVNEALEQHTQRKKISRAVNRSSPPTLSAPSKHKM